MTTPLTKEERGHLSADYLSFAYLRRYEATVRAVEVERDAAVARAEKLREALGKITDVRCGFFRASDGILSIDGDAPRKIALHALAADDAEREQSSDGPPMPHPVAVAFLEALRRDFARDPDSVIALLAADDAERGAS